MPDTLYDIAVIGGGASGLMAALSASKISPALRIVVLERLNRVGKKLMATGNGRCNLTNTAASEKNYHGSVAFMRPAMTAFPPEKIIARFKGFGVCCREEEDGRVYPMSDQASSVLDALRLSMEEAGIEELCDFEASSLTRARDGYRIAARDGRQIIARRVIFSSGGLTAPALGGSASGGHILESCGHEFTPRFPALVQLKTDPEYVRPLKGTKYTGLIDLLIDGQIRRTEQGEILFTEYGLSGIAVMQLSRIAAQAFTQKRSATVQARLHLLPMEYEETLSLLHERRDTLACRSLENFLTGLTNKRLGQMLIKWTLGLSLSEPSSVLTDKQLSDLAEALTGWTLEVTGTQGFDQAQVTAGGVRTDDVDPNTMESLLADGLYITGELLDIDGDCGGYNLQWAWASGIAAGESCARSLTGDTDHPDRTIPVHAPASPRNTAQSEAHRKEYPDHRSDRHFPPENRSHASEKSGKNPEFSGQKRAFSGQNQPDFYEKRMSPEENRSRTEKKHIYSDHNRADENRPYSDRNHTDKKHVLSDHTRSDRNPHHPVCSRTGDTPTPGRSDKRPDRPCPEEKRFPKDNFSARAGSSRKADQGYVRDSPRSARSVQPPHHPAKPSKGMKKPHD